MSVVTIDGKQYAASLFWVPAIQKTEIRRISKAGRRRHNVRFEELVGLGDGDGNPQGLPPLASTVVRVVGADRGTWTVAVATDDGRVCLIHQEQGSLARDGDIVFDREEDAWQKFQSFRQAEGRSFVSAGLFQEHPENFNPFDIGALGETANIMARVEREKDGGKHLLAGLLGLAVLSVGGYFVWDIFIKDPPPPPEPPIPTIAAALDSLTFIAGCENARRNVLLHVGGWELQRLTCSADFGASAGPADTPDSEKERRITRVHSALSGRPVLLAEWALVETLDPPVWRRIAEQELSTRGNWEVTQVAEKTAWAAVTLPPLLVEAEAVPPNYVTFRNAVERAFALQGVKIDHGVTPTHAQGAASVKLELPFELPKLYNMIRPAELTTLEVLRVVSRPDIGWDVLARKQEPRIVEEPDFIEKRANRQQ